MLDGRPMYLILKTDQQRRPGGGAGGDPAERDVPRRRIGGHQSGRRPTQGPGGRRRPAAVSAEPAALHARRVGYAADSAGRRARYVRELEDKLFKPETTLASAIKLEALGDPGVPALKNGLTSEYPLFASRRPRPWPTWATRPRRSRSPGPRSNTAFRPTP